MTDQDPSLKWYFKNSIFPATTVNFGPNAVCWDHIDHANYACGWCAIWGLGPYDPTRGGHLILFDIKKFIQFPPGSLILIPSALMRHGNTPLQPGDQRFGLTQYAAGGLFRWVENGFCRSLDADTSTQRKMKAEAKGRYETHLNMYSQDDKLSQDRFSVSRRRQR